MICAIHQPQTFPYIGYFAKIIQSDIFVFFDDVQFKKNEWQNRNRIKTDKGWMWLTVPVIHKFGQKINEVQINNKDNWRKKHINTFYTYYRKAPYFNEIIKNLEEIYSKEYDKLLDFNITSTNWILGYLKINKKILFSSELNYNPDDKQMSADQKIISILKIIGANTYISGIGAKDYLNTKLFDKENIKVVFQDFKHPVYHQLYGEFTPNLSIIDLLFNEGKKSVDIISRKMK